MKNFLILLLIVVSFLTICCNQIEDSKYQFKEWHESPNRSSLSSTLYPLVEWDVVMSIKLGLTESHAEFDFQYYNHPINTIIYTKSPQNKNYEIALNLSDKKREVVDISFLELDGINQSLK